MAFGSIAILGDGQMGLVAASILTTPDPQTPQQAGTTGQPPAVRLWCHDARDAEALAQRRRSSRLPQVELGDRITVTADPARALGGADLVVNAVPTQFIRPVWERIGPHCPPAAATAIVSVSKGLEQGTLLRPLQIIADVLADDPDAAGRGYAVLSGPTIASEMARCLPATMVAASDDPALPPALQELFTTSWLRIYTGDDTVGVELAGATKNVIAIAAGILDGLQAGHNAKSALLARGLAEITRLGAAMGAKTETFFGLAGVGDLATTCFSPEGRNRSCGEALGKGETLESYLERTESVVEGVATTRSVMELSRRYKVEMPITSAVHAVLYEDMDPIDAIALLMSRRPKAERVG